VWLSFKNRLRGDNVDFDPAARCGWDEVTREVTDPENATRATIRQRRTKAMLSPARSNTVGGGSAEPVEEEDKRRHGPTAWPDRANPERTAHSHRGLATRWRPIQQSPQAVLHNLCWQTSTASQFASGCLEIAIGPRKVPRSSSRLKESGLVGASHRHQTRCRKVRMPKAEGDRWCANGV